MDRRHLLLLGAVAVVSVAVGTEGWDDADPSRVFPTPVKLLWSAPLAEGESAFTVERTDGAEGTVEFTADEIVVRKTNGRGRILVSPKVSPTFSAGQELQSCIALRTLKGVDPQAARGYIRLVGKTWTLAHFRGLDKGGMSQSPVLTEMINGAPGAFQRKICRFVAEDCPVRPVLVVEGEPSESAWSHWTIEDHRAAVAAWRKSAVTGRNPPDRSATKQDEAAFDAALASDTDHVARVVTRGGFTSLEVDGKPVPPVFHKPTPFGSGEPFTFEGRIFEKEAGIFLQTVNIRFGVGGDRLGFWSAGDRFDVTGAVRRVRDFMRAAPRSLFLVTLRLDAYPEYADEHPEERWLLADGSPVYGNCSLGLTHPCDTAPNGMWKWVSNHSLRWQADVKRHMGEFVRELRRTGLAKRIVGVHFAGYHDGQFATMAPDFSSCALEGFKRRQVEKCGRVRWATAPTFDPDQDFFDPEKDAARYAYQKHLKRAPFEMQEGMAREFKRLIGKDVIAGRWCMCPFACSYVGAMDISPFAKSDAIDFLVSQPGYELRTPGVACSQDLPHATFGTHGKLYLGEFDTRTWHGYSGADELKGLYISEARDQATWESLHRKLAGQMMAVRQGWWYFDMADNWFDEPGVLREIADVQKIHRKMASRVPSAWRPSAAIVVDEDGLLLRNRIRPRNNLEENDNMSVQLRKLGRAGVPFDLLLMDDVLGNPASLLSRKAVCFLGVYGIDAKRKELFAALRQKGVRLVFAHASGRTGGGECLAGDPGITIAEKPGGITAQMFHDLVVAAGGYAPAPAGSLQLDMNGDFIAIHCLATGRYDFKLPRPCRVRNLKSGRWEKTAGDVLPLDLNGRESCWFELH